VPCWITPVSTCDESRAGLRVARCPRVATPGMPEVGNIPLPPGPASLAVVRDMVRADQVVTAPEKLQACTPRVPQR